LGGNIAGTVGGTVLVFNVALNTYQVTLTAGIWILQGNAYFTGSGGGAEYLTISNNVGLDYFAMSSLNATYSGLNIQVSRIINTSVDGLGPWYLVAQTNAPIPGTVGFVRLNTYRIG
jgi:hypothetical protein